MQHGAVATYDHGEIDILTDAREWPAFGARLVHELGGGVFQQHLQAAFTRERAQALDDMAHIL